MYEEAIIWCGQLNYAFDAAMWEHGGPLVWGVLWREGLHTLYCMGGEL